MWQDQRLLKLLNIEHPIIQAPMAGATDAALVAAVSNAGALGSLGAAGMPPGALKTTVREILDRTKASFQANLFAAETEHFDQAARAGSGLLGTLRRYHQELGLGAVPEPGPLFGPADEQLAVLVEEGVPVISFHFGVTARTVTAARARGAKILCSATTPREAQILEQVGVDAIVAQGAEAGGHRGTFSGDYRQALIGTLALVPQVVDAVSVPVIAAGGIMDARGVVACLALGAAGVQLGTAFLGCPEAPIPGAWRAALEDAGCEDTRVTEAFSGKPARGLRNRYMDEIESLEEPLLPYPAQYSLSRVLRKAAAEHQRPDLMAIWAGQGVGLIGYQPAADLVRTLAEDSRRLLAKMAS